MQEDVGCGEYNNIMEESRMRDVWNGDIMMEG